MLTETTGTVRTESIAGNTGTVGITAIADATDTSQAGVVAAAAAAVTAAAETEVAGDICATAASGADTVAVDEADSNSADQPEVHVFSAAAHRVINALVAMSDGAEAVLCTKAQLANYMGSCMGTVDHGVQELRKAGYLEVVPRFDESGAQLGNSYRVLGDIGGYVERRGRPAKGACAVPCTK